MTGTAWRPFAFALSLVLFASGAPALAAGNAPGEARRHFDTGVRLAEDRNFPSALVEFEASYQQNPTAAALQNIAVCYKSLFRYAEAIATLERMIADFSAQLSPADRRAAEHAIAEMKALHGTIVIRTNPPGARLTINERPFSAEELGRPVSLAAGQYRIVAESPGYARTEQTITVVSGQKDVAVDVALAPTAATPAPAETAQPEGPQAAQAKPEAVQRGWAGFLALTGDTLSGGGAVPAGFRADGNRQGGALALICGYRIGTRFAMEGQLELAGHDLAACRDGDDACQQASRQIKYTLGTVRMGPAARVLSDGRVLRAVAQAGLGAVGHTVSNVQVPPNMDDPFAGRMKAAGGYFSIGGGAEINSRHLLFDLLLGATVETKGALPFDQRAIIAVGLTLRAGYGAWTP
jgi:hypothetical protein